MSHRRIHPPSLGPLLSVVHKDGPLMIRGEGLTIADVVRVARDGVRVTLTDEEVRRRVDASCDYITKSATAGKRIYGVSTGFGGMANVAVSAEEAAELSKAISCGFSRPVQGNNCQTPTCVPRCCCARIPTCGVRPGFAGNSFSVS